MKKINILVVPSDRTGVGYFRSTNPHIILEEMYPEEFRVDIDFEPKLNDDEWVSQYDIIHYHRTLGPYEGMQALLERLDNLGIVTIMDIDDHWAPGPHHPAYLIIKKNNIDKLVRKNLGMARNITTTTPIFAEEIMKFNKNVHVLPNSIDPTQKQYITKPEPSERIRIGWLGGSAHIKDLELLRGVVGKVASHGYLDKVQFVLCGFDTRGTMTMIDQQTGTETQRPITPFESVWFKYEQIFTDNYSIISPEYQKHLLKFTKDEFQGVENQPYRRVWTKPMSSYASNYNLFDIALAPLEDNLFNKVKSPLKVEEAGFHKKALIAQDFGPYQLDLINYRNFGGSLNDEGNALLVDTKRNHKDWFKHIEFLIKNPELISVLGENLYNTVKDKYSVESVAKLRREYYLGLLKDATQPSLV